MWIWFTETIISIGSNIFEKRCCFFAFNELTSHHHDWSYRILFSNEIFHRFGRCIRVNETKNIKRKNQQKCSGDKISTADEVQIPVPFSMLQRG